MTPRAVTRASIAIPADVRGLLQKIGQFAQQQQLRVYAVGGCVRDWLIDRTDTVDFDVVIEGNAIAFAQDLAKHWRVLVTTHAQFGTATIEKRPRRVDVATCRKETYAAPAAYPRVRPGTLREDLFRRDFTMNAMAMTITPAQFGRLVDPFGGLRDLRAKRLRILHAKSFIDDPSRILRAARFVPRLGLRLESKTAAALQRAVAAQLLVKLNKGRVQKELSRMLEEPDPMACATLLESWLQDQVDAHPRRRT